MLNTEYNPKNGFTTKQDKYMGNLYKYSYGAINGFEGF